MVVIMWPRLPWKSLTPINTEKASLKELDDAKSNTSPENFGTGEELETGEEQVKGIEFVISQPLEDDLDDDINQLPAQSQFLKVITAETQNECSNAPVQISGLADGVIAKVPVILSRFTVQIPLDSIIILPESVLEIKTIHKNIIITQSLLAQNSNILFIQGFIKNNISYAAVGCWNSPKGICGDIRHCTFHIPFRCTTAIIYNGAEPLPLYTNTIQEFEYLYRDEQDSNFTEKDKLLSADFSEYNQISMEFFNDRPYCELESSRIVEFNEFLDCTPSDKDSTLTRRQFRRIEEKTVIFLTFKLLQDQQVAIPRF